MLKEFISCSLFSVIWKPCVLLAALFFASPCTGAVRCPNIHVINVSEKSIIEQVGQKKVFRRVEPFRAGSGLTLTNPYGSVRISGWGRQQISVEADIESETSNDVTVDLRWLRNNLEVSVRNGTSRRLFGLLPQKRIKCDLVISIPNQVSAKVNTVNGNIEIENISGSVISETVNGSVQLKNITGEIEARTINGSVSLARLNFKAVMDSERGGLAPNQFKGIKIETVNGHILAEEINGGIKASTTHGKIIAKKLDGQGTDISIESISGDLDIEAIRRPAQVTAETIVGAIDIQLPNSRITQETKTRTVAFLPGRNNHPQKVILKTVNGKIVVH